VNKPTITVVIPTLDRATTLRSAIESCLHQQDLDCILVSDNWSIDDTHAVVSEAADARLKYIRPLHRMAMTTHWEFALSHVTTDFVLFLGDDDALMPRCISLARDILRHNAADAVLWRRAEYHWPCHPVAEWRNYATIPCSRFVHAIDSRSRLKQVLQFQESYIRLPGVYHGLVAMGLLSRARAAIGDGVYFHTANPDVFAAVVNASLKPRCVEAGAPLSVNAAAARSNGTLAIVSPTHAVVNEFTDTSEAWAAYEPSGLTIAGVAETFHAASELMPGLRGVASLDPSKYIAGSVEAIRTHRPSWERRSQALGVLRKYAEHTHYERWLAQLEATIPSEPPSLALKEGYDADSGVLCKRFDEATVRTAWDAALAIDSIIDASSINVGRASHWGECTARWKGRLAVVPHSLAAVVRRLFPA